MEIEAIANFCSECGQAVAPDVSFCSNCGHRLENSVPAEPEQPAEPPPAEWPPPPKPEPEKTQAIDNAIGSLIRFCVNTWYQLFNVQPPKSEPPVERPAPTEPEPRAEQPPVPRVERNEGRGAMKVLKGCGIAVAVVVGLFIVLLVLGAIFGESQGDGQTDAPVAPKRQEQVSEPEPTATRKPTAAPIPTATPELAATPIPLCEREAESAYMVELAEFLHLIGPSSLSAGQLFTEMGQNPALLFTSEWREGIALSMGIMLLAATSISELEAPDSLDEIDKVAKRMAHHLEEALLLSAEAIDDLDADKLEQANKIFLELPQLTNEITATSSRVCGE